MSFVGVISHSANISAWSRSCVCLAGVSDQILFTVSSSHLSMQAVNPSKTTHGETIFKSGFFSEIKFESYNDGPRQDGSSAGFSFAVSSKHLVMLHKNLDAKGLNYICLRVDGNDSVPSVRKYKLSIEIYTKKTIWKKFQISFQPAASKGPDILRQYDQLVQENIIRHFKLEHSILKSLFDISSVANEGFAINVRGAKIDFTAGTRLVPKDRDLLSQPMSVTVSMAVDDLQETNLGDVDISLNCRLRDIRNFITLVSSLRFDTIPGVSNLDDLAFFEALFQKAGDPLVLKFKGPDISIHFIQITTDDNGARIPNREQKYELSSLILHKVGDEQVTQQAIRNEDSYESTTIPQIVNGAEQEKLFFDSMHTQSRLGQESENDTEYSSSNNESETEFGPTQIPNRARSLFE